MSIDEKGHAFMSRVLNRLIHGGVSPRKSKRLVRELADHYNDLKEEALASGLSLVESEREALARLGEEDALVNEVLSRRELRSWTSRWPWIAYGIAPALSVFVSAIAFSAAIVFLLLSWTKSYDGIEAVPAEVLGATQAIANGGFFVAEYLIPIAIIYFVCMQSVIRKDSVVWLAVGMVLMSVVAAGYSVSLHESGNQGNYNASASLAYLPPFPITGSTVMKGVLNLGFLALCVVWFQRRSVGNTYKMERVK